ncbi:putative serine/threonine-protein kinase PBL25 [Bienertia sinuspersici]
MNCLPCFNKDDDDDDSPPPPKKDTPSQTEAAKEAAASSSNAKTFNFRELAMATKNFRQECLLGEGGFGRVFKGKLQSTGQVVAVKQLDRNGMQGNKEFLVEVLMLSLIQHTNLVSLIGYCADGDQRLLAQPIFRDPKRFPDLADPKLNSEFPVTSLNQAVGICAMCLQEEPAVRPLVSDVVAALSFLAIPQPIPAPSASSSTTHDPPSEQKMQYETESNPNEAPQSEQGSSHYDRSSEDSESSESETESISDQPNEGSSTNYSTEEKDGSSRCSGRESERQDSDRRHSFDNLEEQSSYSSDSDSGGEDTNYDDADTRELDDRERSIDSSANYSLYSAQSTDSSMKSDAGNKSSKHGSSRRSSPTKGAGSRRRKPVVTFKEPSLSGKKMALLNPRKKIAQTVPAAATDTRQQQSSSSSSSESSSESEDEKVSQRHEKETQNVPLPQNNGDKKEAIDSSNKNEEDNHRVFDQTKKEGPKLRHLKTR